MVENTRNTIRDSLRLARQSISADEQDMAAQQLFELVRDTDYFRTARRIAFYNAFDGEINPKPLLQLALREEKECFLPAIFQDDPNLVSFTAFDENTVLDANPLGIEKPSGSAATIPATDLDLVLVPLVGFDAQCFRLGMGKGFYDRTFSFKIFNRRSRPMLIGLAHECQRTESIAVQSWDVRLDAVITAEKIYRPDTA